ncbi:hypothetical protein GCM10010193_37100 [Kitasatospora atroaurantiaca]|uniref:Uncharacterized protein n=1 Tax=Kitasatospora atroaurantiaca TaxID=285545 RepID=A0A561ET31_9ACTN|nr:MarR family transcriptional regulator [Kitasatospora atroaurantiaca]TWE18747.1 hypothetical protein FB465_3836 [Kitasatospora atroaurantiaca]
MTETGSTAALAPLPLLAAVKPDKATLELARVLIRAPGEQLSGTLLVTGNPGGSFHLSNGDVIAVESPGSPGTEALLLRSGRLGEADWAAAQQAGAVDNRTGAELIARMLVGAAELQLMCRMAAVDGAFAMGMGRIDRCTLEGPAACHLAAPQGIEPDWLLQETVRRIRAFGALPFAISPYRDRVTLTPAGAAQLNGSKTGERREILLRVNGRRSSRDIAFLLGRSLYAVTVELSRLLGEGLVEVTHRAASELPLRRRGTSGINDALPLRPAVDRR